MAVSSQKGSDFLKFVPGYGGVTLFSFPANTFSLKSPTSYRSHSSSVRFYSESLHFILFENKTAEIVDPINILAFISDMEKSFGRKLIVNMQIPAHSPNGLDSYYSDLSFKWKNLSLFDPNVYQEKHLVNCGNSHLKNLIVSWKSADKLAVLSGYLPRSILSKFKLLKPDSYKEDLNEFRLLLINKFLCLFEYYRAFNEDVEASLLKLQKTHPPLPHDWIPPPPLDLTDVRVSDLKVIDSKVARGERLDRLKTRPRQNHLLLSLGGNCKRKLECTDTVHQDRLKRHKLPS